MHHFKPRRLNTLGVLSPLVNLTKCPNESMTLSDTTHYLCALFGGQICGLCGPNTL